MKKINEKLEYIYLNRYNLAIKFNMTELSEHVGMSIQKIKRGLEDQYCFDYTLFRRDVQRTYVYLFSPYLKGSEIRRNLRISEDTLTRIYKAVGIGQKHGGDRKRNI